MATVNFSVPEDVKKAFDEAFQGKNKSAILARLMTAAVENEKRIQRRARSIEALLQVRAVAPSVTEDQVRVAREEERP
jgi:hypothetical protein